MNHGINIWVLIEMTVDGPAKVSLELLEKAKSLASDSGQQAIPVICPATLSAVQAVDALKSELSAASPRALLIGATPLGKEISARLSACLDLGVAVNCTDMIYRTSDRDLIFIRPAFDGKLNSTVSLNTFPQIATAISGIFPLKDTLPDIQSNALVLNAANAVNTSRFIDFITDTRTEANLEEAEIIVAGGRGVGSAEGFQVLRSLARSLGGAIGASRVAVEEGWVSKDVQVGATGKTVAPKIYFACGISGAPAHIAGMKNARTIIAINTDPTAPIFDIADYGIVGDLHKVLPAITELLN